MIPSGKVEVVTPNVSQIAAMTLLAATDVAYMTTYMFGTHRPIAKIVQKNVYLIQIS